MKPSGPSPVQPALRTWFPRGARILVGVSGGSDSVALLHLLHAEAARQGWTLGLAHLNHGLRGRESAGDARAVRALGRALGWRVHVRRVDVAALAAADGISIEMAAREARFAFFKAVTRTGRYHALALGHTRDDQAETLLLRLLRGSGLTGLSAMAAMSERDGLHIVRPLLDCRRADLQALLRRRGIVWREDRSNDDPAHLRNRVRHELLPLLEQRFNPSIRETLARTAERVRDDDRVLEELARTDLATATPAGQPDRLATEVLQALPIARARRVLRQWLAAAGLPRTAIQADLIERSLALCQSVKGTATVPAGHDLRVVRRYTHLYCESEAEASEHGPERRRLAVPGAVDYPEWGLRIRTEWTRGFRHPQNQRCGRWPAEAHLSRRWIGRAGLYLRSWQDGDRFEPYGLPGHRKLQDVWVDAKLPRDRRRWIPLLECRGRIVWIPGYRIAQPVAVEGSDAPSLHIRMERLK